MDVCVGLLAHVDAGKTTLSEALLYEAGAKRTLGRVDHGNAFLDTHDLEKRRGITIFSKQARLSLKKTELTLIDTPGHVDFSPEAERVLPVLDCAVLVISGSDGVQAHTKTLWELLERYNVPTILFINKMDLPDVDRQKLLSELQNRLNSGCIDVEDPDFSEQAAMCDEALLEQYLDRGTLNDGQLRQLTAQRKLHPCVFGSALHLQNIDLLLNTLCRFAPQKDYPTDFGARVYKISRDNQGNRLTWLKVTGGSLKVRSTLRDEKITAIRLYSGDKFETAEEVAAGQVCALCGLNNTFIGQGFGLETDAPTPVLEPVMTYRVVLPKGSDPAVFLPKLRLLEEEEPLLRLYWEKDQIHVQIMGKVQLEILQDLIRQRFNMEVTLDTGRIFYKETIENTVEGIGHFEPLRHYAEVHLLLEPLPRGSGLQFDTVCPTDVLDINFQRLILTHLQEKTHLGVLTGAPITDMKLTLLIGKDHVKHTEGGDFRQATYRAVRQGLMQARSALLEPWYEFTLTVPTVHIGRAITDIRAMSGEFAAPEPVGDSSVLKGLVPASTLEDYAQQVAAYTQGLGRLELRLKGHLPCHDQAQIVEAMGYDPEADVENTPDSVFCAHGAGFTVKWDQVTEYMHLDSGRKEPSQPYIIHRKPIDDRELEAIMERQFGPIKRPQYFAPQKKPATEEITIRPPRKSAIIVDGYNIIHAWEELAQQAQSDLDAARRRLLDRLSSYAGFKKCYMVVVFDGYKVKGNLGEKGLFHNISVVYTKENQTADAYIEALAAEIGNNYAVRVATSDGLVQLSSLRSGVLRMSARELLETVEAAEQEMKQYF